MQELLRSDDFAAYRALEIEIGADVLKKLMEGHESPEYFRGAVEMLKKILCIPQEHAKGDKNTEYAAALVEKSFNLFERQMMRRLLNE